MATRSCRQVLSCFAVLACLAAARASADDVAPPATGAVLGLGSREPDDVRNATLGLLPRELARQAILIAARDGLGVATRDQTAREPFPPDAVRLDVRTMAFGKQLHVWLLRPGEDKPAALLHKTAPLGGTPAAGLDYTPAVAELEKLSRGEFVGALQKAGLTGKANASKPDAPAPAGAEGLLGEMTFVAQFTAVRQAHGAIHESGESPALLGVLVRGYANLGQLTRFHWNAAHKVFDARALLYAERMVAADPASASARYHRAYARAVVGLHTPALSDLDEADRLARADKTEAPAWAALLRPLCHYDAAALWAATGDKALAPLAAYLAFVTTEHCPSPGLILNAGRVALEQAPLCLRVIDVMSDHLAVSPDHALSEGGPAALAQVMNRHWANLPNIPAGATRAAPGDPELWLDPATAAAVAGELVAGGGDDRAEPSYALLGRLVQDAHFVHAFRRCNYDWGTRAQAAEEAVAKVRPLVADHPYRAYIEAFVVGNPDGGHGGLFAGAEAIDVVDPEWQEMRLIRATTGAVGKGKLQGTPAYDKLLKHFDDTAYDLEALDAIWSTGIYSRTAGRMVPARRAAGVSPDMPAAMASRVMGDWDGVAPRLEQIDREWGGNPNVGVALAMQYMDHNRYPDAERVLRRLLDKMPDPWPYQTLAKCQLARGDEDGWLQTLTSAMNLRGFRGSRGDMSAAIARHFMDGKKFDRAEPYAKAAAEAGSYAGMYAAVECYEGLGRWDEAEAWVKRQADWYDDAPEWHLWCAATGRGDRAAATVAAEAYFRERPDSDDREVILQDATFHQLEGRPERAAARYHQLLDRVGDPWAGLHAALLYDAGKNAVARDDSLKDVAEKGGTLVVNGHTRPHLQDLAAQFRRCLAGRDAGSLDDALVDRLAGPIKPSEQANTFYFVARFLDLHGRPDRAKAYYERCVAVRPEKGNMTVNQRLAAWELRTKAEAGKAAGK